MYVLEQLWREGLSPSERYTRKGGEYHKILLKICDEADSVIEELTDKGKEHFEAYRQAQIDLSLVAERSIHRSVQTWSKARVGHRGRLSGQLLHHS